MGKVISVTGSLADTVGVKNPLRYRGYYYDVETKLYYLQSRYYDPETCRFINADSLLVAGDDYIQGVNVCKAFLNKNVCLKVAEYYTWAYEGDGAAVLGIAQEISAHALIFYESDKILNVLSGIKKTNPSLYNKTYEYFVMETLCTVFVQQANPIDLGGNGTFDIIETVVFSRLWDYF